MCMSNRRLRIVALIAYNALDRAIRTRQKFEQVETKEFRMMALYGYTCPTLLVQHPVKLFLPQLLVASAEISLCEEARTGSI